MAGVSRSVTIACAYIMTVTELGWRDSINAVRGARDQANPNFGFQRQLQKYENELVEKVWLKYHYLHNSESHSSQHFRGLGFNSIQDSPSVRNFVTSLGEDLWFSQGTSVSLNIHKLTSSILTGAYYITVILSTLLMSEIYIHVFVSWKMRHIIQ